MNLDDCTCRYFVSYSGVELPLNLVTPLDPAQLANRNTYFRAWFDASERLIACERLTYGEVELSHQYEYHASGALRQARIHNSDDETTTLTYSESGEILSREQETA